MLDSKRYVPGYYQTGTHYNCRDPPLQDPTRRRPYPQSWSLVVAAKRWPSEQPRSHSDPAPVYPDIYCKIAELGTCSGKPKCKKHQRHKLCITLHNMATMTSCQSHTRSIDSVQADCEGDTPCAWTTQGSAFLWLNVRSGSL